MARKRNPKVSNYFGKAMTECELELNIRLDVRGKILKDTNFSGREQEVLKKIAELAPEAAVFSQRCDFVVAGTRVPCLAIHARGFGLELLDWAKMANDLEQDCVAIWNVKNATGSLAGPRSTLWGEFDFQKFKRFNRASPSN